jgi:hypothetical protein
MANQPPGGLLETVIARTAALPAGTFAAAA